MPEVSAPSHSKVFTIRYLRKNMSQQGGISQNNTSQEILLEHLFEENHHTTLGR
jgi:hypothetical protein